MIIFTIIAFSYLISCSGNSNKDELSDQREFSSPEIQFTEAMLMFDNAQYELAKDKFKQIYLKDLKSRFNSFPSAIIKPPDDILINALIVKFFQDQQINIDPSVINFIIKRVERDYEAIFNFLKKIDDLSLINKTKISVSFLKKFINF